MINEQFPGSGKFYYQYQFTFALGCICKDYSVGDNCEAEVAVKHNRTLSCTHTVRHDTHADVDGLRWPCSTSSRTHGTSHWRSGFWDFMKAVCVFLSVLFKHHQKALESLAGLFQNHNTNVLQTDKVRTRYTHTVLNDGRRDL